MCNMLTKKILCFHGYMQNDEILRIKSGAFRKLFKNCTFEYINAPNIIDINNSMPLRAWVADDNLDDWHFNSLKIIKEHMKNKEYDGFIGFSQGALIIHHFLAELSLNIDQAIKIPKFIIFISALKSNHPSHQKYYENIQINIKSLHIYGNNDAIVDKNKSIEFSSFYTNKIVYEHDGKHYIPSHRDLKMIIEE